jgi:hypothetical protein
MESFYFASPLLATGPLLVRQESAGVIGFKLYPGALLLVGYFERNPLPPRTRVVELGAGMCGLPSLVLSGAGCSVIATDVPDIVRGLAINLAANASLARCMPLTWCDAAELRLLHSSVMSSDYSVPPGGPWPEGHLAHATSLTGLVDYIVAADVVYHEPLIEPLLQTLVALTELEVGHTHHEPESQHSPPVIIMSYVQVSTDERNCGAPAQLEHFSSSWRIAHRECRSFEKCTEIQARKGVFQAGAEVVQHRNGASRLCDRL